jgi:hypothetical protein
MLMLLGFGSCESCFSTRGLPSLQEVYQFLISPRIRQLFLHRLRLLLLFKASLEL